MTAPETRHHPMPRRRIATAVATTALAVGAAVAAAPAQAAGPTHFTDPLSFSTDYHWLSDVCGFPIAFHVEGSANVIQWTDASGNVTKEIHVDRFRSTFTANGITINGITMGPEIYTDNGDGTATDVALGVVNRRVPGQGTSTWEAGITIHLYLNGDELLVKQDGLFEDPATLCSAFTS